MAPTPDIDSPMQESRTTPAPEGGRRPRLNLDALGVRGGGGERKRGKSMFGVLVNTLNKAKAEDKERSASEAAKKRQMIEQRLQSKLKKETDHVRQIEEAKKEKVTANRREEELLLKDSIHKYRRTHLPNLSNFLSTADVIPPPDTDMDSDFKLSSILPPRSHPPPLYYLPTILTPEQEAFLSKRKELAKEAAEKEWEQFKLDRTAGIEEITTIRRKVATVQSTESRSENGDENADHAGSPAPTADRGEAKKEAEMDVDDGAKENGSRDSRSEADKEREGEKKNQNRTQQVDEDDAVEY
ncbi:hypothetical protein ACEPAG_3176 [Sanghuangporus baumii]